MKLFKYTGLVFLLLVLVLNITGFCWKELRYLSDEEIMASAIIATSGDPSALTVATTEAEALAYLKTNPECCSFVAWNNVFIEAPIFNRLIGRALFGVKVILPKSAKADYGNYFVSVEAIGCCGSRRGSNGGLEFRE